ncbi:unnamed protein product [Phytomonas sp. Hart1]|nr:unnamed protein product [Phytomonas sp. Hart1]|eukprot:CCW72065.1 unnamed protein product [Phytomonas sp. isolate Hart1]
MFDFSGPNLGSDCGLKRTESGFDLYALNFMLYHSTSFGTLSSQKRMSFRYGAPRRRGHHLDCDDVPTGGFVRILFCENGRVYSGFVLLRCDVQQKRAGSLVYPLNKQNPPRKRFKPFGWKLWYR